MEGADELMGIMNEQFFKLLAFALSGVIQFSHVEYWLKIPHTLKNFDKGVGMNNLMRKALLISAVVMTAPGVMAQMANKTYFSARNEHQQSGRSWAMSAPHRMNQAVDSRFGLTANALVFYSESDNKAGLGQYFGAASRADLSDANATVQVPAEDGGTTNALTGRMVDHNVDAVKTNGTDDGGTTRPVSFGGTLSLAPFQKRLGVDLGFGLDLGKMFKNLSGWHVNVNVPIVEVKNSLGATYSDLDVATVGTDGDADFAGVHTVGTLATYFDGTFSQSGAGNAQDALAYGKVSTAERKADGVADVKVALSYDFAAEHDSAAAVHGGVIIPAGKRPTAVDMFEAVYGNGRHVAAFVGGEGAMRLWQNARKGMSLWLSGTAEYTLVFQGREKRVAGLYEAATSRLKPWGHAILGVQDAGTKTFPLANVFARDMYVTPGSHLDGVMGVTWAWKKFHLNFGYNFFYKQSEDIKLAGQWPLDTYGPASFEYDTATAVANFDGTSFDAVKTGANRYDAVGVIQTKAKTTTAIANASGVKYNIDPAAAASSDQQTHTFLASANLSHKFRRIHVNLGFGGSWELASDKSKALEGWNLFGKFCVCL